MPRILAESHPRISAHCISVRGCVYSNSAAKFWDALAGEIEAVYPVASMALTCLSGEILSRDLLFPAVQLEAFANNAETCAGDELAAALADCALLGPPSGVNIEIRSGGRLAHVQELPRDCVDADIFPYLLCWLLAWSDIDPGEWNAPRVRGCFTARARPSMRTWHFRLCLTSTHLSEGLFRRCLQLEVRDGCPEVVAV